MTRQSGRPPTLSVACEPLAVTGATRAGVRRTPRPLAPRVANFGYRHVAVRLFICSGPTRRPLQPRRTQRTAPGGRRRPRPSSSAPAVLSVRWWFQHRLIRATQQLQFDRRAPSPLELSPCVLVGRFRRAMVGISIRRRCRRPRVSIAFARVTRPAGLVASMSEPVVENTSGVVSAFHRGRRMVILLRAFVFHPPSAGDVLAGGVPVSSSYRLMASVIRRCRGDVAV